MFIVQDGGIRYMCFDTFSFLLSISSIDVYIISPVAQRDYVSMLIPSMFELPPTYL